MHKVAPSTEIEYREVFAEIEEFDQIRSLAIETIYKILTDKLFRKTIYRTLTDKLFRKKQTCHARKPLGLGNAIQGHNCIPIP